MQYTAAFKRRVVARLIGPQAFAAAAPAILTKSPIGRALSCVLAHREQHD